MIANAKARGAAQVQKALQNVLLMTADTPLAEGSKRPLMSAYTVATAFLACTTRTCGDSRCITR